VENIQQLQPTNPKKQTKNKKQLKPQPIMKKFYANTHNNNQRKRICTKPSFLLTGHFWENGIKHGHNF
jgi:hypothetical protein